jgi:hypothetical protein
MAQIEPPEYMQGRAFEGAYKAANERKYIHAAADRFDEQYDMIRAVRDKRFKYLKNLQSEKPYYLPLEYRERMATMQELLRLRDDGKLNEVQMQWFRDTKPEEELFDTVNDPHELNNLADDPDFQDKMSELRHECQRWMEDTNDKGFIPETDLIQQFWPNGEQPLTATPEVKYINGEVRIFCATEGASIGYKLSKDTIPGIGWRIYSNPFEVAEQESVLSIAHRIGFQPSDTLIIRNR